MKYRTWKSKKLIKLNINKEQIKFNLICLQRRIAISSCLTQTLLAFNMNGKNYCVWGCRWGGGQLFGFVTVEAFKYSLNASESLSIRQARPFHGIDWNPFSSVDRCIISTQSLYWSTAGIGWRLVALLSKPRYEQFPNVYCCLCFSSMFIPQGPFTPLCFFQV